MCKITLVVLLLCAVAISAQSWGPCNNYVADEMSSMKMTVDEFVPATSVQRNWETSFNFSAIVSAPLIGGTVTITMFSESKNAIIYDLTLPLCGEYSESACALNWKGTRLFGMIPVYTEELGAHNIHVAVRAKSTEGDVSLDVCHETQAVFQERVQGCNLACGTVMATTPGGNPAYSNAGYQGTGNSCGGQGTWGLRYQCVELVQRSTQAMFPVAYAAQMCGAHPSQFHPVSVPGAKDIFVASWGTYGHTAIVRSNNGNGYVSVTEQNGSCTGIATYAISSASCFLRF